MDSLQSKKIPDLFKSLEDCITWTLYEREVKLNPIAEPILFLLAELSELREKVQQATCDIENLRSQVTDCTENITSISNELSGYDP